MDDLVLFGECDSAISPQVRAYLAAALAASTRRAYRGDLRHFMAWGGTLPASDAMIADYLADHAATHAVATLERRLATLSKAHTAQGLPSPAGSALVRATMRGIRRAHGRPQSRVAAATRADMQAMVAGLGDGAKDRRDRALLLLGFAGALRRSELVAIDCDDLAWRREGVVVTLRRGKTDAEGRGRAVAVPCAEGQTCPVDALERWLAAAEIRAGPVFRAVNRHGQISDRRLSTEAVARIVKSRAAGAGLDPQAYAGHSLRAGLATSAAAAGVPVWKIRAQTGHASLAVLERYVRDGEAFAGNAAGAVL